MNVKLKRWVYLIALSLTCENGFSQNQGQPNANTSIENRLLQSQRELDALKRNDSINKAELQVYKVKEGFYSDALSDQAARFSAITSTQSTYFSVLVGILGVGLGLAGYFFLSKVGNKIKRVKAEARALIDETNQKLTINHNLALNRIYRSFSETMIIQSENYTMGVGDPTKGLNLCLQSLETLALAYSHGNSIEKKITESHIKNAISKGNLALAYIDIFVNTLPPTLTREDFFSPITDEELAEKNKPRPPKAEYTRDFQTLFSDELIQTRITEVIRQIEDKELINALYAFRDSIYRVALMCNAKIPEKLP